LKATLRAMPSARRTRTTSPSSSTSSTGTTPSAPSGIGAPVMMAIDCPAATGAFATRPAGKRSITFNSAGVFTTSAARTA
jgi:hypothetical protein